MEWPVKRCYVGLVAVGVQEQAEDILVPPLLRNFDDTSFPPLQNSGLCDSFKAFTVYATVKMSMMMMTMMLICDIDMTKSQAAVSTAALSAETQKWR